MIVRYQRPARGSGATYRSSVYTSLLPWQVRERRFKPVGLGRRGLEPDEVYKFLDRVAGDLAAVYAALAASRRETAVIKDALRRWQSDQARARDARGHER
ncbi:DivIVA domain-containing protein [Micromonospora sp. DR5-3]|uniref:DivIVA domain-containing protein n=1 Tax=unclassified Micromonospora TaxID=2617518 RepID=UPI0011D81E9D|nr:MULTISPECIES: DivIVA domain-containing protein [unclassified Micromonospora]MCW3817861.1 DivIVA domain-containing protein [Micromonospora sp. DR5-3]TYC22973.1 DivIVA domain-containing protein [Micromonospora sp. MP36]